MASPVIELQNVSLCFGENHILKNIHLSVVKGEVFVIVGPSGHGKSVTLKLIAGLLSPTEGQVLIEGKNFYQLEISMQNELRHKIGMLFQKNALFDSLTCGENIGFPLVETTQLSRQQIDTKIKHYLEAVGLLSAFNLYPDEISGGMQKRLGIARALALDPEIILYDDPTAGLDPITSRKIVDLIMKLNHERNSTVVAITNDMNRAYQMADRIGVIIKGELIITGTPQETKAYRDPRVHQFINGELNGPMTEAI